MKIALWQLVLVLLGQRVDADCCDHIAISSNSHGDVLGERKFTIYDSKSKSLSKEEATRSTSLEFIQRSDWEFKSISNTCRSLT